MTSFKKAALLLGKVLRYPMKKTVLVNVPIMKMDEYFHMHFRENDEYHVHDPEEVCKPGDIVLIRELPEPVSLKVNHKLEKIVYTLGHIVDPITGKQCMGTEFVSEIEHMGNLLGQKPRYKMDTQPKKESKKV